MKFLKKVDKFTSKNGWLIAIIAFALIFTLVKLLAHPIDLIVSLVLSFIASVSLFNFCFENFKKFIKEHHYLLSLGYYVALMVSLALFFTFIFSLAGFFGAGCIALNGAQDCLGPTALGIDLVYFSAVTLATLGYGDYSPQGPIFKLVSVLVALIGLYINVVLVALILRRGK